MVFDVKSILKLSAGGELRKDLVNMSRIAEQAERYEDMCSLMKELCMYVIKEGKALSVEERNLLSVAYKNVIGARRASWRTLNVGEDDAKNAALCDEYKTQIEAELESICRDVLDLLTGHGLILEKTTTDDEAEAKVFYLKMAADYYRYLAECVDNKPDSTGKTAADEATDYYKRAFGLACERLQPTHPIRLGLALNYSVCQYEISKKKEAACELAKQAFDDAIKMLDKLDEVDYKDSTLIMQLLRDNLTLWTSSGEENE